MIPIDAKNLDRLLEEGKIEEAQALIEEALSGGLSRNEKAAADFYKLQVYLELQDALNKRYLKSLDEALNSLKEISQFGEEQNKEIDMAAVRNGIQAL